MNKIFYILILLALTSCASLSKEDCEKITWQNEGYKSALNGEPAGEKISYFKKNCTDKYNVSIDSDYFVSGYKQGLEKYCSSSNLYEKGFQGDVYKGICQSSNHPEVVSSYFEGRVIFLEKKISNLEYEIDHLKSENSDLQTKLNNCHQL